MSIRIASKQANKSTYRHRIGAVIVKGSVILGVGHNEVNRYNGRWRSKWPGSLHAEESAILNALKKSGLHSIIGSTLYVSRVSKSGELALAKPCEHCQAILKAFHVKEVHYTTPTGVEIMEC